MDPSEALPPRLIVLEGESEGLSFRLDWTSTIGRDPENTIRLLDERTSRHHAVIRFADGAWTLKDLESANGTWVEEVRQDKPLRLRGGERIRMGNTVFMFEWRGELPPEPAQLELPDRSSVRILNSHRHAVELGQDEDTEPISAATAPAGDGLLKAASGSPRLEVLLRIHHALAELREMNDLADVLLDHLFGAVPARRGAVLVAHADHTLEPVAIRRPPDEPDSRIPIGRSLLRSALSRREAVMTRAEDAGVTALDEGSAITAPMVYQGRLLGVLHLESAAQFQPGDLDLVAAAAAQAAVAVANTRLLERVRKDAEHRANLQRYLAPGLVEQLLEGDLSLEPDGATRQCTLLFADLRGFTAMSEWLPSKDVFATLNAFFQRMVDVVHAHQGSVDKFIGDAVMAVWGIPDFTDDDAANAVLAAVKMQQELVHFNLEREAQGKPPLQMGIGIHSGPVLAGNLGARQRMEYTVIGDTVNVASRIERLAEARQTLVSEATMAWIRPLVHATERPAVHVKGKRDPVKTYEIHGLRDATEERSEIGRNHPRHKTAARVALTSDDGRVHQGLLADWSETGAGVKILPEQMQGLEPGMTVRLRGPEDDGDDSLEGTVVRIILARDHAGQALFKAGVRFRDPPERVRERTRGWLDLESGTSGAQIRSSSRPL
ncbi:MAG: FHA domain-containing protein [Myxococcales bacterium]|nr:FHA domain-containing protein [Myxococcales bacterium]